VKVLNTASRNPFASSVLVISTVVALSTLPASTPVGPAVAAAQTNDPVPASLLRRVAEAADAMRNGEVIWLAVDREFPHEVAGVYTSIDSLRADRELRPGMLEMGPYMTPPGLPLPDPRPYGPCAHIKYPYPSTWAPARSTYCPEGFPLDSINDVKLVIETTTRGTVEIPLPPREVDAVIFNMSAYDKFVGPYHNWLYGPAHALELRNAYAELLSGAAPPR
jgi:hypothetical protein